MVVYTKSCNPPPDEVESKRLERWVLQSTARQILPKERVSKCLRVVSPYNKRGVLDAVEIVKAVKSESFHYANLITCGSVWVCNVCSSKISERRRVELVAGVDNWKSQGGQALLLTLTVPHYQNDSLSFVLDGITDAFRRLTNRKPFKRLAASIGLAGRIRALEVTYGENGWHVHFHVLLFLRSPLTDESLPALEESLFSMWHSATVAAGLPEPSRAHGVKIDNGDLAAEYVGKWGLEHEMTKSHSKKSKDGYSPFDLLRVSTWSIDVPVSRFLDDDPEKAARLFREYAQNFKGRRQLVWSDGLRDLLGLGAELTDEELAEEVEENAARFALIPLEVWRVILAQNLRGQVLAVCRQGEDAFFTWLTDLCESGGCLDEVQEAPAVDLVPDLPIKADWHVIQRNEYHHMSKGGIILVCENCGMSFSGDSVKCPVCKTDAFNESAFHQGRYIQ